MSDYTPSSGAYFNDDGSCGIGVECFFQPGSPSTVTRSWTLNAPVTAVELWGSVAIRISGQKGDMLAGVFIDGRQVWGAILKANNNSTVNLWTHTPAIPIKTSANPVLRVDMQAAASDDSWDPFNAEIRLCGRWQ